MPELALLAATTLRGRAMRAQLWSPGDSPSWTPRRTPSPRRHGVEAEVVSPSTLPGPPAFPALRRQEPDEVSVERLDGDPDADGTASEGIP